MRVTVAHKQLYAIEDLIAALGESRGAVATDEEWATVRSLHDKIWRYCSTELGGDLSRVYSTEDNRWEWIDVRTTVPHLK